MEPTPTNPALRAKGTAHTRHYGIALLWAGFVLTSALILIYRSVVASPVANLIQFDEAPQLEFIHENLHILYWVMAGFVGSIALVLILMRRTLLSSKRAWVCFAMLCGAFGLSMVAGRAQPYDAQDLVRPGNLEWVFIAAIPILSFVFASLFGGANSTHAPATRSMIGLGQKSRLPLIFFLSTFAVFLYALPNHLEYFDPTSNGGHDYTRFMVDDDEAFNVGLVLYTTSALFSAIAALGALLCYGFFRLMTRKRDGAVAVSKRDGRRITLMLGVAWTFTLIVPWLSKLGHEITTYDGWMFAAILPLFTFAALLPIINVSAQALRDDVDRLWGGTEGPTLSEYAFALFMLFPIYPLLRWIRIPRRNMYMLLIALVSVASLVAGIWWSLTFVMPGYDFRGMMRKAQLPFMRVFFALGGVWFVFLAGQRVLSLLNYRKKSSVQGLVEQARGNVVKAPLVVRGGRVLFIVLAIATAVGATFPLWGWSRISENAFTRAAEFSPRHEFELLFLHWLLDADRDGYSALLHGRDTNDFDSSVQAGGFPDFNEVDFPTDEWEIVDAGKAEAFPNLVVFFLEGVAPKTISAYGERRLAPGRVATPHIDVLAAEGTLFKNARAAYPCTWDAWSMINSGRFLRVMEMDSIFDFGDRYSRHNNLYKIMEMVGIERWCHADEEPYVSLFVPRRGVEANWDNDFNANDIEKENWSRGEKKNTRLVEFIQSLKPGERFHLCEHMSDTHFPWARVPDERARELGFEDGLAWVEVDATDGDMEKRYHHEVTRMDAQIGEVITALKAQGVYDNTAIVVLGDHGSQWAEHEHYYYPGHLYKQSIHIPLIIKLPGYEGGRVVDDPVMQIDLMLTLAELAGVRNTNPHAEHPFPSRSLMPLIRGNASDSQRREYRERDMILTTHYDMIGYIHHFKYKIIFDRPLGVFHFFDIENDPMEMHNLIDSEPELFEQVLEKMRAMCVRHEVFLGGNLPTLKRQGLASAE